MVERIPTRFRVPVWDRYIYLSGIVSDNMIRAVIEFAGRVDAERLARAIRASQDAVPIAGCRYVEGWWRPHYERLAPAGADGVFSIVETDDAPRELDRYLMQPFDALQGPLVRACLVRAETDTFCLKMHHLVGDVGGIKEYAYRIAEIYERLSADASYRPEPNVLGSRSLYQVGRLMSLGAKLEALRSPDSLAASGYSWCLPLAAGRGEPLILRRHLAPGRFEALRAYGKAHGATVNDVLLAALYRAAHRAIRPEPGTPLALPVAVDMRRYLPGAQTGAICNLSYFTTSQIGAELGATFAETLQRVHSDMERKKAHWAGVGGMQHYYLPLILLPYGVMKSLARGLADKVVAADPESSGPPVLNNLGALDAARLRFGDVPLSDAYLAATVVDPPSLQLGASTCGGHLTLSIMTRAVAGNLPVIEQLLDLYEQELPR